MMPWGIYLRMHVPRGNVGKNAERKLCTADVIMNNKNYEYTMLT